MKNDEQKRNTSGASRLSVGLGGTGVGNWCAPGPASEQDRKWLLMFEDRDRGCCTYTDAAEAYRAFCKAEAMGWNCHLFAHVPRDPARYTEIEMLAKEHNLIAPSGLCVIGAIKDLENFARAVRRDTLTEIDNHPFARDTLGKV